ncbi:MAG: LapA family protein [Alphaproteobacteria bacterium]|nr:LapA family protein [Alphaproteobacteria bacterium]
MKAITAILSALLLLVLVAFALCNRQTTVLHTGLAGFDVAAPAYILILCTLVLGALTGTLSAGAWNFAQRHQMRKLQKELRLLRDKLSQFETTPRPKTGLGKIASFDRALRPHMRPRLRFWEPRF